MNPKFREGLDNVWLVKLCKRFKKITDATILFKYASQPTKDYCDRKPNHYDILELLKNLTLRHGHRIYRLKDVDFVDFRAYHTTRKGKPMFVEVHFKIQKDAWAKQPWKNSTQKFTLFLVYHKNLEKLYWSGYRTPTMIRDGCASIPAKDFRFNSTIKLQTKDVYKQGDPAW